MGYSFEAAIADIVDNSVSAQAKNIILKFPIGPADCCVAVCDDGIGMSKKELLDAMKYGSQLKSGKRSSDDLGRFGLGMKAASLSQCRRLTVVSKKENKVSAYIWNLDVIGEKKVILSTNLDNIILDEWKKHNTSVKRPFETHII